MKDSLVWKTPVPEQRFASYLFHLFTFISMRVTVDGVNICDGLECVLCKVQKNAHQQHVKCLTITLVFAG